MMKQSKLCKICACIRHDFEDDGYMLDGTARENSKRIWYYIHENGGRITIVLNLNLNILRVFRFGKLIIEYL